ncbi:hypothetical protein GCM10023093_06350 [Nemorincola caseinilytica]|uniref:Uncharacterized protein n=1 Tax=Nemorincola caseinilytica TaxID=2054315 RepID=A0ABP8N589_9BACT
MTDLYYIVLRYWDVVIPTCNTIKEILKEDIVRYTERFQRRPLLRHNYQEQ